MVVIWLAGIVGYHQFFKKNGNTGQCLDFELYKCAIEEALPLGLSQIKFTGGEPLLHPDFVKMAEYASGKNLKTWMETNGTLITRELAFLLKEKTSIFDISVSLDGATERTNDSFRSVKGSYTAAKNGIDYLVEAGFRPQIVMSLFKGNVNEIELLIDIAIKAGCSSVKFNIIQSSGRAEILKENEILSFGELMSLGKWIEGDLQEKYSIPLFFSWPIAFRSIKRLFTNSSASCSLFHVLGLLSTGDMALCGIGVQEKELIFGRVGKDNLKDTWVNNQRLKSLRQKIPNELEGVCSLCIFKKRCLGACVAHNYHASKRLTAPFWFCKEADEKGFFPEERKRTNEQ